MTLSNTMSLPHWDLSNVYPSLESIEFSQAMAELDHKIADLHDFARQAGFESMSAVTPAAMKPIVDGCLERSNAIYRLYGTLRAYIWSFVSTDSFNKLARRLSSELDQRNVPLENVQTLFQAWLGRNAQHLPEVVAQPGLAQEHSFFLQELAEQSRYLMSPAEEDLASELSLSGANAWGRLQGTVSSQLIVPFDRGQGVEQLAITTLQNLRTDPDASIRQRAYEAEMAAWESVREPLAAALNGVKGASITLDKRRGRTSPLHTVLDQSRIDQATLDAMLEAMRASFPNFRRYLRAKARRLGHDGGLPWYDLYAPLGGEQRLFTWPETVDFVVSQFSRFSDRLANMARRAFEHNWIDAEPRAGKRGGAFCMSIDLVDESRVLCNFDGTLDQVFTVAHELGHAFHNDCQVGRTPLQTITPMTMAETASIFCETIVTEAVLKESVTPEQELAILEPALVGATQVIVDITSRFLFESEVFERRAKSELSADDFCDIMLRAQQATYGDGLDSNFLNKYMWAWKPHYYRSGLNFYNFPYAFGLLFGTGLFAIYKQRGQAFIPDYIDLLASTGLGRAADLAGRFGIDLRSPQFWQGSLAVIEKRIARYEQII